MCALISQLTSKVQQGEINETGPISTDRFILLMGKQHPPATARALRTERSKCLLSDCPVPGAGIHFAEGQRLNG